LIGLGWIALAESLHELRMDIGQLGPELEKLFLFL
jgi:hypothetical protein